MNCSGSVVEGRKVFVSYDQPLEALHLNGCECNGMLFMAVKNLFIPTIIKDLQRFLEFANSFRGSKPRA